MVSYTHHIISFCCPTTIRNGINLCHHFWHQSMTMFVQPARTLGHLLLVIYVPILEIFKNMDLGFLIVSYNHHIVSCCCPTTIRNGIHLCHHYRHQSMTMFVQLGHLVIY
jgi:hypothetical protein